MSILPVQNAAGWLQVGCWLILRDSYLVTSGQLQGFQGPVRSAGRQACRCWAITLRPPCCLSHHTMWYAQCLPDVHRPPSSMPQIEVQGRRSGMCRDLLGKGQGVGDREPMHSGE